MTPFQREELDREIEYWKHKDSKKSTPLISLIDLMVRVILGISAGCLLGQALYAVNLEWRLISFVMAVGSTILAVTGIFYDA